MKSPFTAKIVYKIFAATTIVLLALAALPVKPACTFTSNGSGDWSAAVWTTIGVGCSAYPGQTFAGDDVTISAGDTVTLNLVSPAQNLGSLTVNGTLDNSTYNLPTMASLTVNSGGTATFNRAITVSGATDITGTVSFGTNTTARVMTFNGPVTLNAGASWTETAANDQFFFADNFTNNAATFNIVGTGLHTFSGAGRTISGTTATSFPNISFTGSYTNSNTLNAPTSITIAGAGAALTNNGTITSPIITVTGVGITLTNNGTVTVSTSLAGTGGFTNAAGVLNIGAGSTITTLNAAAAGNRVYYTGAANQTVHPNAYSYLFLSGGGIKTIALRSVPIWISLVRLQVLPLVLPSRSPHFRSAV
jgi:hypothetical protein